MYHISCPSNHSTHFTAFTHSHTHSYDPLIRSDSHSYELILIVTQHLAQHVNILTAAARNWTTGSLLDDKRPVSFSQAIIFINIFI